MKWWQFIVIILGGTAIVWPLAASGQAPPSAGPVIGFLSSRAAGESSDVVSAFHRGLSEIGYVEGQNLAIEYRWAEGQYDRLPAFAAEMVRLPVSVLVAVGGEPSALAAKAATSTIPIVFTTGGDLTKVGLVASLSRPGGNATGISLLTTATEAKRLALLHELAPKAVVIGALVNPRYQEADAQSRELQEAARVIGLRLLISQAKDEKELEAAFAAFVQNRIDALLLSADPFFDTKRHRIVAWAAERQLRCLPLSGLRRGRRTDELRNQHHRWVPSRGQLYRANSQGREAG